MLPAITSTTLSLSYETYLDKILGGWAGKSIGGAIGAPWEGYKGWIEITEDNAMPAVMPPNDDLDLQVLWLHVLEEKGPYFRAADLADAWIEGCWYPFNEYGIFRKNYRLGLPATHTALIDNEWWATGMGCPIRSEIWGYVLPGAPDYAVEYARLDGMLDHTEESVGAELLFSAMAADAFFCSDIRRLWEKHWHYLPQGSPTEYLSRVAIDAYDQGLTLAEARQRVLLLGGNPEACDGRVNVPFTFLALLYGGGDLWETILAAMRLGYDTDCTAATAAAFIGQVLGYRALPQRWKDAIGDELVMGIEYVRDEMTISALARDTARMGLLLGEARKTGVAITEAPQVAGWPSGIRPATPAPLTVEYDDQLVAAPGDQITVTLSADLSAIAESGSTVALELPEGWLALPASAMVTRVAPQATFTLIAPQTADVWPMSFRFRATLSGQNEACEFAVLGASLWQLLGVFSDGRPIDPDTVEFAQPIGKCHECTFGKQAECLQCMAHNGVGLKRNYLGNEADLDIAGLAAQMARVLGKAPVLAGRTQDVPMLDLVKMTGEFCAYLAREVICPSEREVQCYIGNTDPFRLYVNGTLVYETEECLAWAPMNHFVPFTLREGANTIVIKTAKRTDAWKFSFAIREEHPANHPGFNTNDYTIDLVDRVPASLK